MKIILRRSKKKNKKFDAIIDDRVISFGASGYSDYTKHKDKKRKANYLARHKPRENWSKSGIKSAGFWSRWALWDKPTLTGSLKDIERRFGVKIVKQGF